MSVINAVSCSSPMVCVAVGSYQAGKYQQTLIERWDGSFWRTIRSPDAPSSQSNVLLGVSCTSSKHCVAVGFYDDLTGAGKSLIETWNGRSWQITPSQDPGTADNELTSVSCSSASRCTAVGRWVDASSPGIDHTHVEMLENGSWTLTASPSPAAGADLFGVRCTSSSCTAVGYYDAASTQRTLIESSNGKAWKIKSSPNVGSAENWLSAVSCLSGKDCVAVGHYFSGSADRTLVETLIRGSWIATPSPDRTGSPNDLFGVSCTTTDCVAAGAAGANTLIASR